MTTNERLRAGLLANSALTDIVGQRVHEKRLPERAVFPAVLFHRTSTQRIYDHDGFAGIGWSRYQFDCIAKTPTAAEELAGALVNAVRTFNLSQIPASPAVPVTESPNFVLNQFSGEWENLNEKLDREIVDVKIWFRE